MAGKQDDQSGPTTRHIRSAMTALDKIAALEDVPALERMLAIQRVNTYGSSIVNRMYADQLQEAVDGIADAATAFVERERGGA